MGKRKRSGSTPQHRQDPPTDPSSSSSPSPSGDMPFSSGRGLLLPHERSSRLLESADLKPRSQAHENSTRLLNLHSSLAHQQHYNLGRSMFLKRSRHHYGHHYSRRNTGSLLAGSSSTSRGRNHHLLHDERLPFRFGTQHEAGLELRNQGDYREKADFTRREKVRFSSLVTDTVSSSDSMKMACGICQKLLRRKPHSLGDSQSSFSGEYAVVAVLVCGHMYHAECLEEKTSLEHSSDPRCPLCCA